MVTLPARLRWVFLCVCCALTLSVSPGSAQDALSGRYRASATSVTASITTWGEDCGPRPKSETLPAPNGDVTVQHSDGQLALQFPGYALRSHGCWSPNPAVKPVSHSASETQWRSECSTPDGDSKREIARYSVSVKSGTALELVNESEYLWQLKSSTCTAKVRSVQQLQRLDAPAQNTETAEASPACTLGKVERIKLRPSEATLEPAQRVCFGVRATDAAGCTRDLKASEVEWSLEKKEPLRATLSGGCFRAADSAAEAEGSFRVSASVAGKLDHAQVKVSIADLSDITAGRITTPQALEDTEEAAQGGIASAGVKALGIETDSPWAVLLGGAALLVFGGVGAWWLLLGRNPAPNAAAPSQSVAPRRPVESLSVGPAAPPVTAAAASARAETRPSERPAAQTPSTPPGAAQEAMICPVCRRGYGPHVTRCEGDGAQLLTYTAFVQQALPQKTIACPECGQTLSAGALFCGQCGRRTQH